MLNISISPELKNRVPGIRLCCILAPVQVAETPPALWSAISDKCRELNENLRTEDISSMPAIRSSRQAYKATGKDPARYRLSAEALIRRAVKDKELYRINNVVDLLNLVSLSTGFSIGGYDADTIQGAVEMGIGQPDEPYTGIGRGVLNIEGLPVFRDGLGAFGTPTSDSERTSVTDKTTRFLMVIIGFGAEPHIDEAGTLAVGLLEQFATTGEIEIKIIE